MSAAWMRPVLALREKVADAAPQTWSNMKIVNGHFHIAGMTGSGGLHFPRCAMTPGSVPDLLDSMKPRNRLQQRPRAADRHAIRSLTSRATKPQDIATAECG